MYYVLYRNSLADFFYVICVARQSRCVFWCDFDNDIRNLLGLVLLELHCSPLKQVRAYKNVPECITKLHKLQGAHYSHV
jgi:hypothetical protein